MKTLTKKRKITLIVVNLVAICGLAIGLMIVNGILPQQVKGKASECERSCGCHKDGVCGECNYCLMAAEQESSWNS